MGRLCKLGCVLMLFCAMGGPLSAQEAQAPDQGQQVEQSVKGIATFPAETQTAVLEICQKPELIIEMAATKKLPNLDNCSESVRKAAATLERYPDIIETLRQNIETAKQVGQFYAQSPDKALDLLKQAKTEMAASSQTSVEDAIKGIAMFPSETQTAILDICQKPELIAQMAKTKALPDLQGCSEAIQNAAKLLVGYPDVIASLNQNLDTAKAIGAFYAQSHDKALDLLKQSAANMENGGHVNVEDAVKGVAMFPTETHTAILEICQKPDLIAEMAKTKALPDLQGCSDAVQNAAKLLIGYPFVISSLNENMETSKAIGAFYAKSPDKAVEMVKQAAPDAQKEREAQIIQALKGIASYPPETRKAIVEVCQKPDLIVEMAKTKALPDLQAYSAPIQDAAKELIQYPQVIETLNERIEMATMLGNYYARSPQEVLDLLNRAADEVEKDKQAKKEKWVQTLKDNPKALQQYKTALQDYQKDQAAKAAAGDQTASTTDVSLQADVSTDDVTIYSAPPPEVVDYVVVNADRYPDIAVNLSLFGGGGFWPYPAYWPGPVYSPWGPWYHPWGPWYHPWGPWYHPWGPWHHGWGPYYNPYGPWHHGGWGPGPHPGPPGPPHPPGPPGPPHPWPPYHPPLAPLQKPTGPLVTPFRPPTQPVSPLLRPGSQAPLAFHDMHGLVRPDDLQKNPQTLGEWSRLRKDFPDAQKPLVEDKQRVQDVMSRRNEFPNLSKHMDEFGESHPDHEMNEWRKNPMPSEERRDWSHEEPTSRSEERPMSVHSGEYSRPQHISSGCSEHRSSWGGGGMSRGFGGGGRGFGGGGRGRR